MAETTKNEVPQPSMLFYFVATTIYAVVKYNISDSNLTVATVCYIITIVIGHYFMNVNLVNATCNGSNWRLALIITVVPWVLMFSTVMIMLYLYPGWKSPFSNTFGYALAKFSGAKEIMNKIFPQPGSQANEGSSANEKSIKESLAYIYTDQSLLINEVTVENYDDFWEKTKPIRSKESYTNAELKEKFLKLIKLKDIVGEYIWYLLTGSLVTAVGYNYLVATTCDPTVEDIKRQEREYEEARRRKEQGETEGDDKATKYAGR